MPTCDQEDYPMWDGEGCPCDMLVNDDLPTKDIYHVDIGYGND